MFLGEVKTTISFHVTLKSCWTGIPNIIWELKRRALVFVLAYSLAGIFVLLGFAGTLFPILPGLPLLLAGLLWLAGLDAWQHIGWLSGTMLVGLTVFGMVLDFVAGVLGAKASGASRYALWGAFWGSIAGIALGLIGVLIGPFVGAALGELWARKEAYQAGRVGVFTVLGVVLGTVVKLACACAMLAVFALSWWL